MRKKTKVILGRLLAVGVVATEMLGVFSMSITETQAKTKVAPAKSVRGAMSVPASRVWASCLVETSRSPDGTKQVILEIKSGDNSIVRVGWSLGGTIPNGCLEARGRVNAMAQNAKTDEMLTFDFDKMYRDVRNPENWVTTSTSELASVVTQLRSCQDAMLQADSKRVNGDELVKYFNSKEMRAIVDLMSKQPQAK